MDFEQAVEDWKAHDQWEFADKEAAWGFFFMAGRESKQRENEMDPHIDGVVPVQMTDAERGFLNGMLIGNLRRIYAAHDDEGNDLSALPSRAADEIERMRELADSEGTRAVEYLRRARKSEANVARLMLEEEGAKDAFAHVVQQKHDADAECKRLRGLLDAAHADIRRMSQTHNALAQADAACGVSPGAMG